MKTEYFSKTGNRFKANLHCHTMFSDGDKTPEEIKRIYLSAGYSIVAYSDHNILVDHSELNDDRFLAMIATEYNVTKETDGHGPFHPSYHINFFPRHAHTVRLPAFDPSYIFGKSKERMRAEQKYIGSPDYKRSYENVQEMLDIFRKNDFIAMLNHPTWSGQTAADYMNLDSFFAVELYNHGCYTEGYQEVNDHLWDELLWAGKRVFGTATDDNHNHYPEGTPAWDSCGGFTVIQADELTQESVVAALEAGKFYASRGPLFESIVLENDILTVETSPVVKITISTGNRRARPAYPEAGKTTMTSATFDLSTLRKSYVRLTIEDEHGLQAWSQPIWDYTGKQD